MIGDSADRLYTDTRGPLSPTLRHNSREQQGTNVRVWKKYAAKCPSVLEQVSCNRQIMGRLE